MAGWLAGTQARSGWKGYSAEEIIGQSFTRFYTPEDLQAGVPQKALRMARETGRFEAEGWHVRKDGSTSGLLL